nr:hypothetical protein [Tanacetum cinerariifolium]
MRKLAIDPKVIGHLPMPKKQSYRFQVLEPKVGKLIGSHNLRLRNRGLMNGSLDDGFLDSCFGYGSSDFDCSVLILIKTWWSKTIKPSSGMMCQGVRKEIQTKGIIGDFIHFDALAIGAIGPPRPFKDGWHNSFTVRRSGTGRSPFPLAAISKSFKRVGSAQRSSSDY